MVTRSVRLNRSAATHCLYDVSCGRSCTRIGSLVDFAREQKAIVASAFRAFHLPHKIVGVGSIVSEKVLEGITVSQRLATSRKQRFFSETVCSLEKVLQFSKTEGAHTRLQTSATVSQRLLRCQDV